MATTTVQRSIDPDKMNILLAQAVSDMGAALHGTLVLIGDRLGLYRAMADGTPMTAEELSRKTGTAPRYVREWLNANAASHYLEYDAASDTYWLTPEQSFALAQKDSALDLPGFFYMAASAAKDEEKLADVFRTGKGFGWHEHEKGLFLGCERFFRPTYLANLLSAWIPALAGVREKLQAGARVADVGCGHGASTILMAKAFPNSKFFGFDYHAESIAEAKENARAEGVDGEIVFQTASAKEFPGGDYDFITFFDCLHDMGDPVGAARHVQQALSPEGVWMVVEPRAADDIASNLNPVGRIYYSASALMCVPASLSQEVALGLGAQAGEMRLRQVIAEGGFTHIRRAAETPFNMVLEVRR